MSSCGCALPVLCLAHAMAHALGLIRVSSRVCAATEISATPVGQPGWKVISLSRLSVSLSSHALACLLRRSAQPLRLRVKEPEVRPIPRCLAFTSRPTTRPLCGLRCCHLSFPPPSPATVQSGDGTQARVAMQLKESHPPIVSRSPGCCSPSLSDLRRCSPRTCACTRATASVSR